MRNTTKFLLIFLMGMLWAVSVYIIVNLDDTHFRLIYKNSEGKATEKIVTKCIVDDDCVRCREITVCGDSELIPIYK